MLENETEIHRTQVVSALSLFTLLRHFYDDEPIRYLALIEDVRETEFVELFATAPAILHPAGTISFKGSKQLDKGSRRIGVFVGFHSKR